MTYLQKENSIKIGQLYHFVTDPYGLVYEVKEIIYGRRIIIEMERPLFIKVIKLDKDKKFEIYTNEFGYSMNDFIFLLEKKYWQLYEA